MRFSHIKKTVLLGIRSLQQHKLRTVLTMLGIIFGVCSVIAMLAIGEGASYEAQEQIRQLGSNNILLRAVKPPETAGSADNSSKRNGFMLEYGLTYNDAERIRATVPGVDVVVPLRRLRREVRVGRRQLDTAMSGTVPWYLELMNRRIQAGRFISADDMAVSANVCVLELGAVRELFPLENPLGQVVKTGNDYFKVVGVLAPVSKPRKGNDPLAAAVVTGSAYAGREIFVPLTTMRSWFGDLSMTRRQGSMERERIELHEIVVKVKEVEQVIPVAGILKDLLARFHPKPDYEVVVPLELLQRAEQIKRTFSIVLGSIAAISLLVGGIGIMNIMLATVTERTREIGIRRALGAKRRHIIAQFLTETVLLSGVGGLVGIVIGVLVPFIVEAVTEMKTIVTLWSVLAAFSVSVLVGVVFGLYPARRAAAMDPIEALRHE